jgi:hypothetical protein
VPFCRLPTRGGGVKNAGCDCELERLGTKIAGCGRLGAARAGSRMLVMAFVLKVAVRPRRGWAILLR